MKTYIEKNLNISLESRPWLQIKYGGFGLRTVTSIAQPS